MPGPTADFSSVVASSSFKDHLGGVMKITAPSLLDKRLLKKSLLLQQVSFLWDYHV
jgi:hypothetical protein